MKKFWKVMAALVLLTGVFLLASCAGESPSETTEPVPTANDVFMKMEAAMDALDSYEASGTLAMTTYLSGNPIQLTVENRQVEAGMQTGHYYFFAESKTHMVSDALGINEETRSLDAYHQGNAYLLNEGNACDQRLYFVMASEEYRQYYEEHSSSFFDEGFDDCKTKTVLQNEDGSFLVEYTDFANRAITKIAKEMGFSDAISDNEISDIKLTLLVDKDFHLMTLTLTMIFDVEENAVLIPRMTMTANYFAYNTAVQNADEIYDGAYVRVEDVRYLDAFEDLLAYQQEKTQNTFILRAKEAYTVMGKTSTYLQENQVTYGERDGAFYYHILSESEDETQEITYEKGVVTVCEDEEERTERQSEADARAYIDSLFSSIHYDRRCVSRIEKLDDLGYEIEMTRIDDSAYRALIKEMGMRYVSSKQRIYCEAENGVITRVESTVYIQCTQVIGNLVYQVQYNIRTTLIFQPESNGI